MSDVSLLEQVQQVGRRAHRLLWLRALLMAISVGLLLALGTVLLDYILRIESPALRWSLSIGTMVGLLGIGIRWLGPVVRLRQDEVRTARWIERSLPALQDRLSSAVQFLSDPPDDPTGGSTDLRSALVRQTVAQFSEVDVDQVLDNRGARRAAWAGVATLLLLSTLALVYPVDLRVGLVRLMFPWKSLRWPTVHALSFASLPSQVAKGSRIRVQVIDTRGELPARVQLWYWPQGSRSTAIARYDMQRTDDMAEWTLPTAVRPFRLRAVGGDHRDMSWVPVNVVEAPMLVDVTLSVTSPAYTAWPVEHAEAHFQALRGSRVRLDARANRPLRQASLVWRDEAGASGTIPLSVSTDGSRVTLDEQNSDEWQISNSVQFGFDLIDRQKIEARPPYGSVTALTDHPPTVEVRRPREDWVGGPRALVPLQVQVADDLTVQRVQLCYTRSDQDPGEERAVLLLDRSDPPRSRAETLQGPDLQTITTEWDLSQIKGLQAGVVVSWYLSVEDNCQQRGTSPIRSWTLPTDDELQRRFARDEQQILTRVSEVVTSQQQAQQALDRILQAWQQGISTWEESTDELQAVSLAQCGVRESLTESPESILHDLQEQLDVMRRSRVDSQPRQRRQREWIASLRQLNVTALAPVEELLNRSIYRALEVHQADDFESIAVKLPDAARLQSQVIRRLQQILVDLRQQDVLQTLLQQLSDLREEQRALLNETSGLVEATVSRSVDSMPASLRDRLLNLGDRQFELARRAEQIVANLDAASTDTQTAQAERLAHARQMARQTGLTNQMRRAAEELSQSRVGNAAQQQREIELVLQQLLDCLHGNSSPTGADQRLGSDSGDVPTDRHVNARLVPQHVQDLLLKQDEIGQATAHLEQRIQQQPTTAAPLVEETKALAEQQRQLSERTLILSQNAASLRVSSWVLNQVAAEMRRAADLLQGSDAGIATQKFQRAARARLSRLLQTWQTDSQMQPATTDSSESPDQNPPQSADLQRDSLSLPSAEIRLLMLLQQDLNQRTRQLASRRASAEEPNEHTTEQLGELARQQGELAKLLVRLLSAPRPEVETSSK